MTYDPDKCALRLAELSRRETMVLRLLADGFSQKEIGGKLSITGKTVSNTLMSVYFKLGVHSSVQATRVYLAGSAGLGNLPQLSMG